MPLWPFGRAKAPAAAPIETGAGEWRSTPPIQRAVEAMGTTLPTTSFEAGLTTRADPSFLRPLEHLISSNGPSGVVSGLIQPTWSLEPALQGRNEPVAPTVQRLAVPPRPQAPTITFAPAIDAPPVPRLTTAPPVDAPALYLPADDPPALALTDEPASEAPDAPVAPAEPPVAATPTTIRPAPRPVGLGVPIQRRSTEPGSPALPVPTAAIDAGPAPEPVQRRADAGDGAAPSVPTLARPAHDNDVPGPAVLSPLVADAPAEDQEALAPRSADLALPVHVRPPEIIPTEPVGLAMPAQMSAPVQRSVPVQPTAPGDRAAPVRPPTPPQMSAPVQRSLPVHPTAPADPTAPAGLAMPPQVNAPVQRSVPVQPTAPADRADPVMPPMPIDPLSVSPTSADRIAPVQRHAGPPSAGAVSPPAVDRAVPAHVDSPNDPPVDLAPADRTVAVQRAELVHPTPPVGQEAQVVDHPGLPAVVGGQTETTVQRWPPSEVTSDGAGPTLGLDTSEVAPGAAHIPEEPAAAPVVARRALDVDSVPAVGGSPVAPSLQSVQRAQRGPLGVTHPPASRPSQAPPLHRSVPALGAALYVPGREIGLFGQNHDHPRTQPSDIRPRPAGVAEVGADPRPVAVQPRRSLSSVPDDEKDDDERQWWPGAAAAAKAGAWATLGGFGAPLRSGPRSAAPPLAGTPIPDAVGAPTATTASGEGGGFTAAGQVASGSIDREQLDSLADDLYDKIRDRLRSELRVDRERRGRATDLAG